MTKSDMLSTTLAIATSLLVGCAEVHATQEISGNLRVPVDAANFGDRFGFSLVEARTLLQFCIDMDAQDDLLKQLLHNGR